MSAPRTALVTGVTSGIGRAVAELLAGSIEACAAAAGPVDVLVNNAGESQAGPLEELPEEAIRRLFELNVFGPVLLTQALAAGMRQRGYGRIVMVGSMLGSFRWSPTPPTPATTGPCCARCGRGGRGRSTPSAAPRRSPSP